MSYFLSSEIANNPCGLFQIIPIPYEGSVSYGKGTSSGPTAIISASDQLETFDGFSTPADCGFYTHPPLMESKPTELFSRCSKLCKELFKQGKIVILIGGEHSITNGVFSSLKESFNQPVGIIQIDAHADLRDQYLGSKWSHASVMRRAVEQEFNLLQIGVRAYSLEEAKLIDQSTKITSYTGFDLDSRKFNLDDFIPKEFPEMVYLSIDVDGLDPSIMPATGTPVPGGLQWYELLKIIKNIAKQRQIVGFDIVELAPIKELPAPDFLAAELLYRVCGEIERNRE